MIGAATCIACGCDYSGPGLQCETCRTGPRKPDARNATAPNDRHLELVRDRRPMPPVLRLVMPWTALSSDNNRKGVVGRESRAKTKAFADALDKCRDRIRQLYDGEPCGQPVRVTVTVWYPDNSVRDTGNFWKLIADALKGIVIVDDRWQNLKTHTMDAGGIDRDQPRAEIIVERI